MNNLAVILFICALILGTLGYIEKILNLKFSRNIHIFFLIIFLVISMGQYIFYNYELQSLEKEIEQERSIIHDFEVRIIVKFSGEWSGGIETISLLINEKNCLNLIGNEHDKVNTKMVFFNTKPFIIKDIDKTHGYYESQFAINKGDYPLGYSIEELMKINRIDYIIPFYFKRDTFISEKILIEDQEIEFFINGKRFGELSFHSPFYSYIKSKDENSLAWVNITLRSSKTNLYEQIREKM